MSSKPLINESLLLLNVYGVNPANRTFWTKMRAAITTALIIHLIIELALEIVTIWNLIYSIEIFLVCASFIQVLFKIAAIIINGKRFDELIKIVENFTSWDDLEDELKSTVEYVASWSIRLMKTFLYVGMLAAILLTVKPLFAVKRILPFDTYHPHDLNNSIAYYLTYLSQTIETVAALFCLFGCDFLFVSFTVHVVCELKIIKKRFRSINVWDQQQYMKEVCSLVDHHNYVLRCIEEMDKIYAVMLLMQFSTSVVCICTDLLCMVASGFPPDLTLFFYISAHLYCVLMQLFIYCVGGTFLIDESEGVSSAVYKSDWWAKTQPKFRYACVMVIQRANKTEKLTAGGMFVLNLETFTKIVKFGLSVFSFAQAMNSKVKSS